MQDDKQKVGLRALILGHATELGFLETLRNRSVLHQLAKSRALTNWVGDAARAPQHTGRGARKNARARKALSARHRRDSIIVPSVGAPAAEISVIAAPGPSPV